MTINGKPALFLVLKGKWYDLIEKGIKKEEYRAFTVYWCCRLYQSYAKPVVQNPKKKPFEYICFQHGYTKTNRVFTKYSGFELGTGRKDWGAEENEIYFKIQIGSLVDKSKILTINGEKTNW